MSEVLLRKIWLNGWKDGQKNGIKLMENAIIQYMIDPKHNLMSANDICQVIKYAKEDYLKEFGLCDE